MMRIHGLPTSTVRRRFFLQASLRSTKRERCAPYFRIRWPHRIQLSSARCFSSSEGGTEETGEESSSAPPPQSLWQQIRTPPNVITITRMASTPLLAYWIVSGEYYLAIGGCTLAAMSDFLDGYLAKHYGWTTVLGTYLDPLADKAFLNALGISLCYSGVLPTPLVTVWVTKDILLLSGTAWFLYKKHGNISILSNSVAKEPLKVTPSMIAKVNTTLQFSTLVAGLLFPVVSMPPIILDSLW